MLFIMSPELTHLMIGSLYSVTSFTHFPHFPGGSDGKESACNGGDLGLIPGLGRSPGERKGYPIRYSGLENSMGGIVLEVTKSQKPLSDFHFHFPPQLSSTRVVAHQEEMRMEKGR